MAIGVPQHLVGGVGTSDSPALAAVGPYLYMAWKGVDGDPGIWWSRFEPTTGTWGIQCPNNAAGFQPQCIVGPVGTSDSPALVAVGGRALWMAWKGVNDEQGIYYSAFRPDFAGTNWEPQSKVGGVGTSDGPALGVIHGFLLWMAWKGANGDQGIWWSTYDGVNTWGTQCNGAFQLQCNAGGVGTSDSPALAAIDISSPSYMAWKGVNGDQGIWWSTYDGTNWV